MIWNSKRYTYKCNACRFQKCLHFAFTCLRKLDFSCIVFFCMPLDERNGDQHATKT